MRESGILGLVALQVIDTFQAIRPVTNWHNLYKSTTFIAIIMVSASVCGFATYLDVDYPYRGILLIILSYLFRGKIPLLALFSIPLMYVYGLTGYLLALAVIATYNHQRGFIPQGNAWKYAFYAYYPANLILIRLL